MKVKTMEIAAKIVAEIEKACEGVRVEFVDGVTAPLAAGEPAREQIRLTVVLRHEDQWDKS